jgi:DNA-binding CsgD family transcriptional regulator
LGPLFDASAKGRPLEQALVQVIHPLGFDTFFFGMATAATLTNDSRYYFCTNASLQRIAEYDQRSYIEVDPRVVHAWNSVIPFAWDRRVGMGNPKVEAFLEDAARWGVGSGICVPLRGELNSRSVFAVNTAKRDLDDETRQAWSKMLGDIVLLAMHFHDVFVRTVIDRGISPLQQGRPLSHRELQCLQLAARGMTSADIGSKLGLSQRTVDFHFCNIISKLAAANRHEAIALGISQGLITT